MDHERVISKVVAWANTEENIRLVVLVGSVGRGDADVDELSDLDLQLYVTDPERLLADPTWHRRFGEVLVVENLPNPGWYPTRLCYYVDAKIDFILTPVGDIGVDTYDEPFRVLLDKDHASERLPLAPPRHSLPSEPEFSECVNWFYAAAIMGARCVARDEPWLAKNRDADAKQELLKMIVWDHRARYGPDYDTWFLGKHLDQWMDADVREALDRCWGAFPVADARAALIATVELYERLACRTAEALGLAQPLIDGPRAEVARILATAPGISG
ncbi:MAG TPA: aminoglycoside 6-adenylyltransferase [Acidimicrobiales bacterium]|nr:aminoglycoside 6-adenylyltransferase [Acidimicrobiales bacterium]